MDKTSPKPPVVYVNDQNKQSKTKGVHTLWISGYFHARYRIIDMNFDLSSFTWYLFHD